MANSVIQVMCRVSVSTAHLREILEHAGLKEPSIDVSVYEKNSGISSNRARRARCTSIDRL